MVVVAENTGGAVAESCGGMLARKARGRPFPKGVSGNPGGRVKKTEEEELLVTACRKKSPEALAVVEELMRSSSNDRVRLAAAQFIIERAWGKAPERYEVTGAIASTALAVGVLGWI